MNFKLCIALASCHSASPLLITAAGPENLRARSSEVRYINRFLASKQLPRAGMNSGVQSRNGWVYELDRHRFVIARRLGERDARLGFPAAEGPGELVWLRFAGGAWQAKAPKHRQRPSASSTIYFQSHAVPAGWARALKLDPAKIHFFTVLQCELTIEASEELNSPATWELPAWFNNAAASAKKFGGALSH